MRLVVRAVFVNFVMLQIELYFERAVSILFKVNYKTAYIIELEKD